MRWSKDHDENRAYPENSVVVNVPTQQQLLDCVEKHMNAGEGYSIATLNLDHVVKLRSIPAFEQAYLAHTYVTADGNPIVWLSQLAGHPLDLLPGSELIEPVTSLAARNKIGVALFGSTNSSLQAAAVVLKQRYPDIDIRAVIAPPMGFEPTGAEGQAAIKTLHESGAQLCLLALGAPKQEIFAARAQSELPKVGFMSIGAGLDFISGQQVRAPQLVRRLACEWLWRLANDPRRLSRRYAACAAILPSLLITALQHRYRGGSRA